MANIINSKGATLAGGDQAAFKALETSKIPGVWKWDVKRDILTGDQRLAEIFSVDRSLVSQGAPLSQVLVNVHPADHVRLMSSLNASIELGGEYCTSYRIVAPDGLKWVQAFGKCFLDTSGKPEIHAGLALDISGFKATLPDYDRDLLEAAQLDRIAKHSLAAHRISVDARFYEITHLARMLLRAIGLRIARSK